LNQRHERCPQIGIILANRTTATLVLCGHLNFSKIKLRNLQIKKIEMQSTTHLVDTTNANKRVVCVGRDGPLGMILSLFEVLRRKTEGFNVLDKVARRGTRGRNTVSSNPRFDQEISLVIEDSKLAKQNKLQ
jgi:hypothetical protein